jgi:hypothetical protein
LPGPAAVLFAVAPPQSLHSANHPVADNWRLLDDRLNEVVHKLFLRRAMLNRGSYPRGQGYLLSYCIDYLEHQPGVLDRAIRGFRQCQRGR